MYYRRKYGGHLLRRIFMNNFGGYNWIIILIIIVILFGGFGCNNGCGCNNNGCGCM